MDAEEYFGPYEREVRTLAELHERAEQVKALAEKANLTFFWRGQSRASWGIHSLLHRGLAKQEGVHVSDVKEPAVVAHEKRLVAAARDWIRPSVGARLATIDLFARLQHYGVPTRLIDFSRDYRVALYFAVAQNRDSDGRLIAAAARREFADDVRIAFGIPWARLSSSKPSDWNKSLFALPDQADFLRIQRQEGVFITGGTPSTVPTRAIPNVRILDAPAVRSSMSIPLVLHGWGQAEAAMEERRARGRGVTVASALTLRLPASTKSQLCRELEALTISWQNLFPDAEGFREHSEEALGVASWV